VPDAHPDQGVSRGSLEKLIAVTAPPERLGAPRLTRQRLEQQPRLERTEPVFVRDRAFWCLKLHAPRVVTRIEEPLRVQNLFGGERKVSPERRSPLARSPHALNEGRALQVGKEERLLHHPWG